VSMVAENESVGGSPDQSSELKTFVAAVAAALRETVIGFEETVTRITEITAMRPGGADRDLVVALQNFDRLQQEFATLGDVLAKLSGASGEHAVSGQNGASHSDYDVLASVSLAGLKDRLSGHLRSLKFNLSMPDGGADEAIF
jgi:hypothetical protein